MIPDWLHIVSICMVLAGLGSFLYLLVKVVRHPQHMGVMNVVWPITGLYAGPLAIWFYERYGRLGRDDIAKAAMERDEPMPHMAETPYAAKIGKGATHCGAGCTLGDIIAETLAFMVPAVALWFGYKTIFADKIFAVWILDYILAFLFGIAFQYASIKPMNPDMGAGQALIASLKADTLSLTSWQVGMYGFMALAHFAIFGALLGVALDVSMVEFWAAMQIAMICGFITAYPVNRWLIGRGIKEAM
ncbi:MAG: DUF4396 domain-containing protein [Fulvimarina manganoxydans]|uniref:DUF4396 domain-containing protein n=1 Tax=Fulvimarina manganoxydans TaxID=937218 RepID=UPI00235562D7|nr:DUF4396 domain-containing protein [Fulvimarina manganoxydans]MCK5930636.1 DUF4396 domain-containing protein [Fulvimarina manganoxydans]